MNDNVRTKLQAYADGQSMPKKRYTKPRKSKKAVQEQPPKPEIKETVIEALPIEESRNVIFKPNDGPQTEFLAASEREVLYGGSA